MGRAFRTALVTKHGLPGIGKLWKVFEEVRCHRGCPISWRLHSMSEVGFGATAGILTLAASTLLALLKANAPRTVQFLTRRTGYSTRTVRCTLKKLDALGYVHETNHGSFILGRSRNVLDVETWAFELKLEKPGRAIFQAQQYRAFAHRVLIVVPPGAIATYVKFEKTMQRWGLGLASFDPLTGSFAIKRSPRSQRPRSRQHQLYAVFQLLRDSST